jgi:hypothetical protein
MDECNNADYLGDQEVWSPRDSLHMMAPSLSPQALALPVDNG